MKNITIDYTASCLVPHAELIACQVQLEEEIDRILNARTYNYDTDYASVNLPFDQHLVEKIKSTVKEKKSLQPTMIIVIGIGGSNLGTVALYEALYPTFQASNIKVYFADTVDTDYISTIAHYAENELKSGHAIILNVISKSGTTTETIANFEFFLEIVKKHRPTNYHECVVVTTDKHSALWQLAQQEKFTHLEVPALVGGRYSVFSAVGLFPLCFLDIDIDALLSGAQSGFVMSAHKKIENNPAALSAALLSVLYKRGCVIHDTFIFDNALEGLGKWYRQLMAESIGKAYDNKGNVINTGITPTVSIGSTDLHSVAQLYLAGPYNRFTTFVSVEKNKTDLKLPHNEAFEALVAKIQGKSFASIMNAILEGTKKAYQNDERPFVSLHLPEKSAYVLGQFMQIKMIEIMYLGFLMNINPFDQPQVELYKKETRQLL